MRIAHVWKLLGLAALLLGIPAAASAADPAAGKKIYEANCQNCHGPEGKGDGPTACCKPDGSPLIDPAPRNFAEAHFKFDTDGDGEAGTDADLKNVIKNGAMAYGGSPLMTPWGFLSDQDIENLIAYIRSLHE